MVGSVVISRSLGNKRLGHDFVPNDARRTWSGPLGGGSDNIAYAIDATGDATPILGGLTAADTRPAILRAMNSWGALTCSTLPLTEVADFGLDIGLVAFLNGLGGSPFIFADIQHAGFRDIDFAGGILGVTFTFIFVDGAGVPTDIAETATSIRPSEKFIMTPAEPGGSTATSTSSRSQSTRPVTG